MKRFLFFIISKEFLFFIVINILSICIMIWYLYTNNILAWVIICSFFSFSFGRFAYFIIEIIEIQLMKRKAIKLIRKNEALILKIRKTHTEHLSWLHEQNK